MTPEQQAELRAAAHANPACADAIASRDLDALARALSAGRTRPSALEIGNGTILELLGIDAGNRLLEHIRNAPDLRYVAPLLEQGRLKIGAPTVQAALRAFSADVLTPDDCERLCAAGCQPDPLTPQGVAAALYNPDGSLKPWQ